MTKPPRKYDNDSDLNFDEYEILLGLVIHMAPAEVRARIVEMIKQKVSLEAGTHAKEIIDSITGTHSSGREFLEAVKVNLKPELQGPVMELSPEAAQRAELENLLSGLFGGHVIVTEMSTIPLMELEMIKRAADPNGFAEVTPGCNCPRCTRIMDAESKGLRIRNNGTTVAVDRLN